MQSARLAEPREYFPALTGLRFLLAVWVVYTHICGRNNLLGPFTDSLPVPAGVFLHHGWVAVQTFFVLSGFVLAQTYSKTVWTTRSLKRYVAARVARIYPVYLFSLLIVVAVIFNTMAKPNFSVATKAGFVFNYVLVLQGWGDPGVGWNTPAWTLSCEFFFYLFFPLLIRALRSAGCTTVAIVLAGTMVWPMILDRIGVPDYWKPVQHMGDFVAGILTARIYDLVARRRWRGDWLYVPAALAGVWLISHPHLSDGFRDLNTPLRPLNVAGLLGLALGGGVVARGLSTRIADFLGKASYSMYITHIPFLWLFAWPYVFGLLVLSRMAALTLYSVIVLAGSILVYRYVEIPANRAIRAWAANAGQ